MNQQYNSTRDRVQEEKTTNFDIVRYIKQTSHDIWNKKNIGKIYEYCAPNIVGVINSHCPYHCNEQVVVDSIHHLAAFPDTRIQIDDVVWSGNDQDGYKTSVRWTIIAHHTGSSKYGLATGRKICITGITNSVVKLDSSNNNLAADEWQNGQTTEAYIQYDELSVIRQLDLSPFEIIKTMEKYELLAKPIEPEVGNIERRVDRQVRSIVVQDEDCFHVENFVRKSIEDIWNHRLIGNIENYYSMDFRYHGPGDRELEQSHEYQLDILTRLSIFPNTKIHIDDFFCMGSEEEGFRTSMRWTLLGNHGGFGEYGPPTGKKVRLAGITNYIIREGKFVEEWTHYSEFGLMQQLRTSEKEKDSHIYETEVHSLQDELTTVNGMTPHLLYKEVRG
ncbi:ester cyclase [Peribacillus muralis]|uniref:ester cyclase n=1 Tax=Peribacillus muralis TaxID=264697 RepID=UPI00070F7B4C|nr:ester cyclase [Peribacillus muralis]